MNHPIFFSVAVLNLIKGVYYKYIQLVEVVSNTVFHPIFFRLGRKKSNLNWWIFFTMGLRPPTKENSWEVSLLIIWGVVRLIVQLPWPQSCTEISFLAAWKLSLKQVTGQLFLHNSNLLYLNMFISASFNVATYVGNSCATSSNLIHSINTEVSQSCK